MNADMTATDNPLVSIIIPCYNAEKWVAEAIQSALDQTYRPIEVIVIDDGSTDGSLEIIKSFGERIRYETGPNRGGCAARNRGFALSKGEYVLFLDADDWIGPETVLGHVMAQNRNALILTHSISQVAREDNEGRVNLGPPVHPESIKSDPILNVLRRWGYPLHSVLYSKPLLAIVGPWDELLTIYQDSDIMLRALLAGAYVVPAKKGVAYQRVHSGHNKSMTVGSRISRENTQSLIHFITKAVAGLSALGKLDKYAVELGSLYFSAAQQCFAFQEDVRGEELLGKAYQLAGRKAIQGSPIHHILCRTIGLRRKEKLVRFLARYGIATRERRENMRRSRQDSTQ